MALFEMGAKKFPIPVGDAFLGSDAGCAIQLTGAGTLARHAVLQARADGQVVIRKAALEAEVLINGVRLGAEPTPLLHGDKVEVGGQELTFVDERRSGSTQFLQAVALPQAMAQAKAAAQAGRASGGGPPTLSTGGRVVCLTDGREYVITGTSLVFGREAGCDVVVAGKDVSRQHAEIMATPKGYLLVDSSTNGTFVNETRIEGQRILARADIIRLGDEQFRFYADVAPPPAPVAAPAGGPPPGASERLKETMHGLPGVPAAPGGGRPSQAGPLASFLVRTGELKGRRLQVRTPIANIGRADYNDIVIPEPSVSTSHAKLQRREGVWVLVDLESTNGTFVDGERVQGDSPLAPGAVVRFGDVSLVFEPTDEALGVAKGGGTVLLEVPKAMAAPPPPPAPPPPAPAPARPPPKPAPAAPKAKPPAPAAPPARAPAKAQPKRPPPQAAKGKGCGSSATVFVLGGAGLGALIFWLLA